MSLPSPILSCALGVIETVVLDLANIDSFVFNIVSHFGGIQREIKWLA